MPMLLRTMAALFAILALAACQDATTAQPLGPPTQALAPPAADLPPRLLAPDHARGTRLHPWGRETGVTDSGAAYAVQRRYVPLMTESAGATAGYKIGLTSARMEKMCNIDGPVAAIVVASRVMQS